MKQQTFDPRATLVSARIRLEPLHPSDAIALYMPLRAPHLYDYVSEMPPLSVAELKRQFKIWTNRPDRGVCYIVKEREHGHAVGMVRSSFVGDGRALMWSRTFAQFLGYGYSLEAARCLKGKLIEAGLQVEAHIDPRNSRARKMFEAGGFVYTRLVENADYFDGESRDEIVYIAVA